MTENLNLAQLAQQLSPQALVLTAASVGRNKADYEKLKQAFYSAQVNLNNFAPSPIDLRSFAWQTEGKDRNWWWQLQALPFLSWYLSSFKLQTEEEQQCFLDFCLSAFECWCVNAEQNPESPLNWHDHATAFRLRNLVNWFSHCVYHQLHNGFSSDARLQSFVALLTKHLLWLADESNYSKNTNHGFDQALVMYTVALSLPNAGLEQFLQLGKSRLIAELLHAFTDEGVHKENSPGYQKFMLGRVKTLVNLDTLGDIEVSSLAKDYIEKAEAFLKALTMPNGELPMIGDTKANELGILAGASDSFTILDYSESGYVIVKGKTYQEKDFYLLVKNTHESHYHRHDDDLSIFLFYDGEELLTDGGLGSHNEKDPKRIKLRSSKAHNVPYIKGKAAERKIANLKHKPVLSVTDGLISGFSYSYGVKISRTIDIRDVLNGEIIIHDDFESSSADKLAINFITPFASVKVDDNALTIESNSGKQVVISNISGDLVSSYIEQDYSGRSVKYGEYIDARIFGWLSNGQAISTKIKFC